MLIGDVEIRTPLYEEIGDNPTFYEPMWPNRVAATCVDKDLPLPDVLKDDPMIQEAYKYIKAVRKDGTAPDTLKRKFKEYHNAMGWSQCRDGDPTRHSVDAMLLCPSPLSRIIEVLELPKELVSMYEHCFFNVRRSDGKPANMMALRNIGIGAPQRITADSPQDLQMRAQAMQTPVEILVAQWGSNVDMPDTTQPRLSAHLMRLAEYVIAQRLRSNELDDDAVMALVGHGLAQTAQDLEAQKEKANSGWEQVRDLMAVFAPQLLVAIRTDAAVRDQSAALQRKLVTENNIKGTKIEDKGLMYGKEQFSAVLDAQFKDAQLPPGVKV
jgi:hypothetical protein